jgi:hypothetical protein
MANYLKNHSPSTSCGNVVPMELWNGRKPTVSYFKLFGCTGYVTLPKRERQGKFGPRGKKMIFLGYCENRKGYRMWDSDLKKIITSRDVVFKEEEFGWNSPNDRHEIKKDEENKECIDFTFWNISEVEDTDVEDVKGSEDIIETMSTSKYQDSNEEENSDSVSINDLEVEELMTEEKEVTEPQEEEVGRILRERTSKVKPSKYSAITSVETAGLTSQSNKKYEKKRRRLERVKERKKNERAEQVHSKTRKEASEGKVCLDIFSKYGP